MRRAGSTPPPACGGCTLVFGSEVCSTEADRWNLVIVVQGFWLKGKRQAAPLRQLVVGPSQGPDIFVLSCKVEQSFLYGAEKVNIKPTSADVRYFGAEKALRRRDRRDALPAGGCILGARPLCSFFSCRTLKTCRWFAILSSEDASWPMSRVDSLPPPGPPCTALAGGLAVTRGQRLRPQHSLLPPIAFF